MGIEKKEKKPKLKLNSIEDLPKFMESNEYTNAAGIKLITKFLSEEDEDIKSAGGVWDLTGFDGIPPEEDEEAKGSELRN